MRTAAVVCLAVVNRAMLGFGGYGHAAHRVAQPFVLIAGVLVIFCRLFHGELSPSFGAHVSSRWIAGSLPKHYEKLSHGTHQGSPDLGAPGTQDLRGASLGYRWHRTIQHIRECAQ